MWCFLRSKQKQTVRGCHGPSVAVNQVLCIEVQFFLFLFFICFIYFYFFNLFLAVVGSSLLCVGFLQLWRAGATLRCGVWASHCGGFSCCGARALGAWASVVVARGLQSADSVVVAHGLSCSAACGIFPDQGSNPCPLHWQADSQPLGHQGSPKSSFLKGKKSRVKAELTAEYQ